MTHNKFITAFFIGMFAITTVFALSVAVLLYAQTPGMNEDKITRFLRGGEESCPNFSFDQDSITMRDECTGVVWAKTQLPTSGELNDQTPGYTYQEASAACAALTPAGRFRLPTVEEALTLLECDETGCTRSPLVVQNGENRDGSIIGPEFDDEFAGGVFWTSSDFDEPQGWRDDGRDYHRSINLLSGEVDNPVFSKEVRLNAWCVVNRAPYEENFKQTNAGYTITYNTSCAADTDCDSLKNITGITQIGCNTEKNRCEASVALTAQRATNQNVCAVDTEHVEAATCITDVQNRQPLVQSCAVDFVSTEQVQNAEYAQVWKGNDLNGVYECAFVGCEDGFHWNPNSAFAQRCEQNLQTGCDFNVPNRTDWTALVNETERNWQETWDFAFPKIQLGRAFQIGQGEVYENGWSFCQATSCAQPEVILPEEEELTASPVLVNHFDEPAGSATVFDDTNDSNEYVGTMSGATLGAAGKINTAVSFNGNSDRIAYNPYLHSVLGGTASMSFWIKTTQVGNNLYWDAPGITGVEEVGGDDDVFWGWIDDNGKIGVQAGDSPGAKSAGSINDNTWHHVVLTRNAATGNTKVFIDGELESEKTSATGTISSSFNDLGRITRDEGGGHKYFHGLLDELQIFQEVISEGDVTLLYQQGVSQDPDAPEAPTQTVTLRAGPDGQFCGCVGDSETGTENDYYWEVNTGTCEPRLERIGSGHPNNIPFAVTSVRTCDGGQEPWEGPSFNGCQWTAYRAEGCIENAVGDGQGGCVCLP